MKKLLLMLIMIGMLVGAGGCIEGLMPTWKYPIIGGTWAEQEDEQRKKDNPYIRYLNCKRARIKIDGEEYVEDHPRISDVIKRCILDGFAISGMTREQVIAAKGEPNDKNYTVGSWGTHEQWVYGGYDRVIGVYLRASYFYFENGILTSYQY